MVESSEQGIHFLSATGKEKMTKKTEKMKYRYGSRLFQPKLFSACSTSRPGSKRVSKEVRALKFSQVWKKNRRDFQTLSILISYATYEYLMASLLEFHQILFVQVMFHHINSTLSTHLLGNLHFVRNDLLVKHMQVQNVFKPET